MHTTPVLRALAAAALTTSLTALCGTTLAQAAEAPPTTSSGILAEAWGAPIVNDLFEVSTSSWTASAGTSPDGATMAAVTVTAVQDVDFRLSSWFSTPERITSYVSGTCPVSIYKPTVAMNAGDQCSIWVTYGAAYSNQAGSVSSQLSMSASNDAGDSASAVVPQQFQPGQLLVNGLLNGTGVYGLDDLNTRQPVDFGEVMVGSSGEDSFTMTNVSSDAVEVDMTGLASTVPFSRGAGVGETLTIEAGQTVTMPVLAAPTSTGSWSTWREKLQVSNVDGTLTSTATAPDLKVTGVARTLSVTADDVDFGTVTVGDTVSRDLLITNTGADTVTIDARSVDPDVAVEVPTTNVEPGGTVRATATWTASALGALSDTVEITVSDQPAAGIQPADASRLTASVTGEAVAAVVPPPADPTPVPTASPTTPPTTTVGAADPAPTTQGILAVTGAPVALAAALAAAVLAAGVLLIVLRRRARR